MQNNVQCSFYLLSCIAHNTIGVRYLSFHTISLCIHKSSSKYNSSPLEKAEESVRQRLNTKFEKLSPEPVPSRPVHVPLSPTRESPGRLPQYPPGGYFPPPGYNMYPPYMYPPYMMPPQQMMQQGMMPPMGGMMQQPMMNGGMQMPPQMMNGAQRPPNNPQYDPYQVFIC